MKYIITLLELFILYAFYYVWDSGGLVSGLGWQDGYANTVIIGGLILLGYLEVKRRDY